MGFGEWVAPVKRRLRREEMCPLGEGGSSSFPERGSVRKKVLKDTWASGEPRATSWIVALRDIQGTTNESTAVILGFGPY